MVTWQCWAMVRPHDLGRLLQAKQSWFSMDKPPHAALYHRVRVTMLQASPNHLLDAPNSLPLPSHTEQLLCPHFCTFHLSAPTQKFPLPSAHPPGKSPRLSRNDCRLLAQVGAVKFLTRSLSGQNSCPQPSTQSRIASTVAGSGPLKANPTSKGHLANYTSLFTGFGWRGHRK